MSKFIFPLLLISALFFAACTTSNRSLPETTPSSLPTETVIESTGDPNSDVAISEQELDELNAVEDFAPFDESDLN